MGGDKDEQCVNQPFLQITEKLLDPNRKGECSSGEGRSGKSYALVWDLTRACGKSLWGRRRRLWVVNDRY